LCVSFFCLHCAAKHRVKKPKKLSPPLAGRGCQPAAACSLPNNKRRVRKKNQKTH
jgi:hypothetical protein